jgi:hypothetical protein
MSNRLAAAGGGGNGGVVARNKNYNRGAGSGGDPDVLRNINYYNPTIAPPKRMSNRVMRVVSGPGEAMMAVPVNNYGPSSTDIAAAAAQRRATEQGVRNYEARMAAFYAREAQEAQEAAAAAGGGDPDVLRNINYYNPTIAEPSKSSGVMRVVSGPGEPMMAVPVNNYGGRRGRRGSMSGGARRTRKKSHRKNRRYSRRN